MIHKFFPGVKYWCTNKFFLWKHIFPIASWASDWLRTNSLSHWVWGFRFNIKIWILTLHRHPGNSALWLCCWCLETQTQNKPPLFLCIFLLLGTEMILCQCHVYEAEALNIITFDIWILNHVHGCVGTDELQDKWAESSADTTVDTAPPSLEWPVSWNIRSDI